MTIRKFTVFSLLLAILNIFLYSRSPFVEERSILPEGPDEICYFSVWGAVMSPQRDVYILDSKDFAIVKFDRRGQFVGKMGKKGKGPGDFLAPADLQVYENRLYICDNGNNRISSVTFDFKDFQSVPIPEGYSKIDGRRPGRYWVIGPDRFIGGYFSYDPRHQRLMTLHKSGKTGVFPYNYTPGNPRRVVDVLYFSILTQPVMAVHPTEKIIAVTSSAAGNPVRIFLYDFDGKLKQEISFPVPAPYSFPQGLFNSKKNEGVYNLCVISRLDFYKNQILAHMEFTQRFQARRHEENGKNTFQQLYILDRRGKLLKIMDIKPSIRVHYLSEDGTMLGRVLNEEEPVLRIYRVNF